MKKINWFSLVLSISVLIIGISIMKDSWAYLFKQDHNPVAALITALFFIFLGVFFLQRSLKGESTTSIFNSDVSKTELKNFYWLRQVKGLKVAHIFFLPIFVFLIVVVTLIIVSVISDIIKSRDTVKVNHGDIKIPLDNYPKGGTFNP